MQGSFPVTYDQIYERLMRRYGPQGWWPARARFEVALGAVLTQGTAWTNAAKAISILKQTRSHRPQNIARLSESELAGRIRPAGFHNVKARRLKALTRWWLQHGQHQALHSRGTNALRRDLLDIHGIGPETADAILLYAFKRRVFVVDTYARRLFSRIGLIDGDEAYEQLKTGFEAGFTKDFAECNEYHALIVEHGKTHCRAKPVCEDCCLAQVCRFAVS